ncbi:hypothetical protein EPUS_06702 [Endocarpon pusillum Z07020]|uniref:Amino acid permease/ SLC12A domain-containing protein n=1 Tax=Endocarpon pusillum (strain Z07020 / HMAS-L-300199) TaxID=1263415 RepID=U1HFW5_ENDPU|nr:uncharacterized protein EPUS_06702 [Endocarpon pusillum Z07020]ERF69015.1 hypothetical protein EPUS_06702 [Endocarpon pusillum Z07020]
MPPPANGHELPGEVEDDPNGLRQDLDERHVNMIAFSSVLGIGLFLQAGRVIYYAGPSLALFAYLLTGTVMWSAMACLGEMTALFPVKGAVFEFPGRFLDEAVGYAVGWMAWYFYVVVVAAEVTAVSQLFKFQFDPSYLAQVGYPEQTLQWGVGLKTNPAVWATILLIIMGVANLLPVRAYGEIEYVIGVCKMLFICMLIILNVVINTASFGTNEPSHFKYYEEPYSFQSQNFTLHGNTITGGPGHLASMWTAMTTTMFGMAGFDASIKLATRKISLRIILLYTLATFTAGLNVPYTDPNLKSLAAFLNAFYVFSATSAGINALYLASRLLHALACIPEAWPRWSLTMTLRSKLQRTSYGVPKAAVFASWLFGLLGFLAVKPTSAEILGRIAINSVVSNLIVYCLICASYLRFYKCINRAARGVDPEVDQNVEAYNRENDSMYPYKSHLQYLRAWYGLCGTFLFALFNGWRSVVSPMSISSFLASYFNIPVFLVLILAYRIKLDSWDPRQWIIRANQDLRNPVSVTEQDPRLRRGRLRRRDRNVYWSRENARGFLQWIWVWLL